MELADRNADEVEGPGGWTSPERKQGPAMSIAMQCAHDVGNGVVVADTVHEMDDAERVAAEAGDGIDLAAGIDRDSQTHTLIDDVDVGLTIDNSLIAGSGKMELIRATIGRQHVQPDLVTDSGL